jgi:hypothetical protein
MFAGYPNGFANPLVTVSKNAQAHLPMSSAAIPGSFLSPIGSVIASVPSGPLFGHIPKYMKFSQ